MRAFRCISFLLIALLLVPYFAFAAPAPQAAGAPAVLKVRFSQAAEQTRIVLDMTAFSAYKVKVAENPLRLIIDLPATANKTGLPQIAVNNSLVGNIRMVQGDNGNLQAIVELKQAVLHKVFTLTNPNRLVIDVTKFVEEKIQSEVAPGVSYTSWRAFRSAAPMSAHILEVDPQAGFTLQPVLSNGQIKGLDSVSAMARSAQAVAAVNGSYFSLSGEIIGLMKVNGTIVSTPELARTAFGVLPDHSLLMDQVAYHGYVQLPDGSKVPINGINRERGEDELIVYNGFYSDSTGTNNFGVEYIINDNSVMAVSGANTPLSANTVVLSAHGKAMKALAALKPGDPVKVSHALGEESWDKAVQAIGAGPRLVQNSSVFLTTKIEEFGSDVAGGRAPRTAIGITKQGHVLLVVVDGRQTGSVGMTLLELALFMQELGAVDAMNLDGGGSSEMVINDKIVNIPSDGRERKVGNALAVVPTKLAN